MGNPLQDRRPPQELAARRQVIEISNKISDFKRLCGIVAADLSALDPDRLPPDWRDAVVSGVLRFDFADARQRLPALQGQVAVTIDAVCQRCLRAFAVPLAVDLRLLFAADQAASGGYQDYEVWELDGDTVSAAELVEEVLIMAMPYVAMHADDADCRIAVAESAPAVRMTRPFANLKTQMDRDN